MSRQSFSVRRMVKAASLAAGLTALIALRMAGNRTEAATAPPGAATVSTPGTGDLDLRFGDNGLERVAWHGVVLSDAAAFQIGHMKMTGTDGRKLTGGEYDWGESAHSRAWDPATRTWLYRYGWGSLAVRFVPGKDRLDIVTTATNLANSGVVFQGATVAPLRVHFPMLPKGFGEAHSLQLAFGTDGPNVTLADFGSGELAVVVPAAAGQEAGQDRRPLYSGFVPAGGAYDVIVSGTAPDGLAAFQPHFDRSLQPGRTESYTLSLRFGRPETPASELAGDALRQWAAAHPMQLHWNDRRPLGTIYLAASPRAGDAVDGGNPRRYFVGRETGLDVRTPAGLERFQNRVLHQAAEAVTNLRRLGAQGVVTWDIEGEQYPQETSYLCAPDTLSSTAPEMESVIGTAGSPYRGMRLADAYFRTLTAGGLRVGVCVRPQRFTIGPDGSAHQQPVSDAEAEEELRRKMRYAHDRWGATLFYVDSSVRADGSPLPASVFARLQGQFPDALIMPEESTFAAYAYTAPFLSFLFHGDVGTASGVRAVYPQAFSVNLVNDAGTPRVQGAQTALVEAVRGGDVLMAHAGYWAPENTQIQTLYRTAGLLGR